MTPLAKIRQVIHSAVFRFSFSAILLNSPYISVALCINVYQCFNAEAYWNNTHSDYQWKLSLGLRIHMILKAFYCSVEDYILTLLMPWKKISFYCSLSAILMFADSINRIMVRLLFSTALECVAFFCTELQKLLSNFFLIVG